ncbi:helix-turn-helix domain-containing protein [Microvirga sp. 2MCAF38]|uniref:helix-turn-helix domain-containing protein n=1 Tax=Microvirga sp. 2MCAF38 TaxID=3232989 RepID=UPI003F97E620
MSMSPNRARAPSAHPNAAKAPSQADRRIGQRVRLMRIAIGLSQEKLADALGITFQQVQKYERGTNRIGAGRLQEIARVLSVPVASFYDADDQAEGSLMVALDTPDSLPLLQAFTTIGRSDLRRQALEIVRALAKVKA